MACVVASFGAAANPTGGVVVSGTATIQTNGSTLTVTNSPNSIINWQNFSISVGETTSFVQQSSTSTVLNRVVGLDQSQIFGNLTSNGRVYLINTNGVLFGPGAQLNMATFVATTSNVSDSAFLASGSSSNFINQAIAAGGSVFGMEGFTQPPVIEWGPLALGPGTTGITGNITISGDGGGSLTLLGTGSTNTFNVSSWTGIGALTGVTITTAGGVVASDGTFTVTGAGTVAAASVNGDRGLASSIRGAQAMPTETSRVDRPRLPAAASSVAVNLQKREPLF